MRNEVEKRGGDIVVDPTISLNCFSTVAFRFKMMQQLLLGLGLTSLLRPTQDGVPYSTVLILLVITFWCGFILGAGLLAFAVSPSLRYYCRAFVLRVLSDDDPARRRLQRYRQD